MKDTKMKAEIKNGQLTITLPVSASPKLSKTGKTLVLATSQGNRPMELTVNGTNKTVWIGVNAYTNPS